MTTHRRTRLAVASATLGVVAATTAVSSAHAATLECGDTISVDTVLTEDLVCGPGDALVIVADGVTVDLSGHTIQGPGAYTGAGAGVRAAQRRGVTVMGGTITGFQSAVVLDQSWDSHVTKLTVSLNDQAINIAGGGRHLIDKNTSVDSFRDAIRLGASIDNRVTRNTVTGNVFGISVADGSSGNTVDRNVATGNRNFGIATWGGGSGNVMEKNQVSGSVHHGIQVNSDVVDVLLLQNLVSDNGDDGIHVETSGATITKNTAVYNGDLGISAPAGVDDGGGNMASGNGNVLQCLNVWCEPAF